MLQWPHGGHGDCKSARAGYGVRRWARPAGARVGGRFTALQRHRRRCRFEAFTGANEGAPSVPSEARNAENASLAHECGHPYTGGVEACRANMPPTASGGQLAPGFGRSVLLLRKLRIYGFAPLPPRLPRSDPRAAPAAARPGSRPHKNRPRKRPAGCGPISSVLYITLHHASS